MNSQLFTLAKGNNLLTLDITSIAEGMYFIKAGNTQEKFVKQ